VAPSITSARALAEQLGFNDAVELLQATLDEESAADEKLNAISLGEILRAAPTGMGEETKPATATAKQS
jgi:ferritin-like metal-binding protein YciE